MLVKIYITWCIEMTATSIFYHFGWTVFYEFHLKSSWGFVKRSDERFLFKQM